MAREDAGRIGSAIGGAFRAAVPVAARAWQSIRSVAGSATTAVASRFSSGLRTAFASVQATGVRTFAVLRAAGLSAATGVGRAVRGIGGGFKRMGGGLFGAVSAVTAFTPLGPVFSMLLTVLPAVGGALSAVGAVLLSLLSPVGLLIGGISALVVAWFGWTEAGRATGSALVSAFQNLFGVAKDTVMGIANALAAGDMQSAGRIAAAGLKAVWYTAAGELARIWPTLAAGATDVWKRITTAAGAAAAWVANVWAQVPTWITGPLGAVGSALSGIFGPVLSWLGEQFTALWTWVKQTVGGIAQAIAAGQWGTAAQIAWISIKQAFAAGVTWLQNIWDELTTGLALGWDAAIAAIRNAWSMAVSWIAQQLVKLWGLIQSAVDAVASIDPTGLSDKLKKAISIDVAGTVQTLQDDQQRESAARNRDAQQQADARGAALAAREKERQAWADDLARQRDQLLQQVSDAAGAMPAGPSLGDKMATAKAELDAAIKAAQEKAGVFDPSTPDLAGVGEGLDGLPSEAAKMSVSGTFNAAAVAGLGADNLAQRTARASEQVAQNTGELVKQARNGNLVFA